MFVYVSNTNLLRLNDLTKESDGSVITGASVTVTVKDAAGVNLVGSAWPQGMIEVGSGDYELQLSSTLSWIVDAQYTAFIDAVTLVGIGHWEHSFKARRRTSS